MRAKVALFGVLLVVGSMASPARAGVGVQLVAGGFDQPVGVTNAGDGSGRLFVVERDGVVRIVSGGAVLPEPFIDIRSLVESGGQEQGLLSIAFHPSYETNGSVFLSYTGARLGQNVLARYQVSADPNKLDPGSATVLFQQPQPFANHNGGLVLFGPDGYLYMGIGDGGLANDPFLNGQNPLTLLGTIIRIDVDALVGYAIPSDNPFAGADVGADEIWAFGLRNPWRFSFDSNGDLYIADVGQNAWEEVNVEPASSPGGVNYGWNVYEGTHAFMPEVIPPYRPYTMPVLEYNHSEGCSITGGPVYRGASLIGLNGAYLFGEYCRGTIWAMTSSGGTYSKTVLLDTSLGLTSFGEDEAREVYVTHIGQTGNGALYKLVNA